MKGLYSSVAIIGVLVLAACVDTGPTTQGQITQDINSSRWMSSDLLQFTPSDTARTTVTGDERVFP
jgi:hypothetical protein